MAINKKINTYTYPQVGSQVKGKIINKINSELWVDFGGRSFGIIPAREARDGLGTVKMLNIGDTISATVVAPDNAQGYTVLSLKRAAKDLVWDILKKRQESQEIFEIVPKKANKGGLMAEVYGVIGFLPVSQLSIQNYPRVKESEKAQIIVKLNKLVGKPMKVIVMDCDKQDNNKLIFSEKAVYNEEAQRLLDTVQVGDELDVTVTDIKHYGVFVSLAPGLEGMIHISEIAHEKIQDISTHFQLEQVVKAKVVSKENDRISLSTKALQENPWERSIKSWHIDSEVVGKVVKYFPFGVKVSLKDDIPAMCHTSELSDVAIDHPRQVVDINKEYKFKILEIDHEKQRIELTRKGVDDRLALSGATGAESGAEEKKERAKKTKVEPKTAEELSEVKVTKLTEEYLLGKGLSSTQAEALLKNVKTVEALDRMSKVELLDIDGIGPKAVEKLGK